MNGVYWGLTALFIMGKQDALDREAMVEYVMSCWDDEAGEWVGRHLAGQANSDACRNLWRPPAT